jgi:hypothetical protein
MMRINCFSISLILPAALRPGVYSASNRPEAENNPSGGQYVGLTTLPPSVSRLSRPVFPNLFDAADALLRMLLHRGPHKIQNGNFLYFTYL